MKLIYAVLILMFLSMQAKLWSSDSGFRKVWALEEKVTLQKQDNLQLKQRNLALDAEVQDLKRGVAAVEERARTELGMIKRGETFYQLIESK